VPYKASVPKRTIETLKMILNAKRQLGVSEIARALSINKSTAFRILRALEESACILKDASTRKYVVGEQTRQVLKDDVEGARPCPRSIASSGETWGELD